MHILKLAHHSIQNKKYIFSVEKDLVDRIFWHCDNVFLLLDSRSTEQQQKYVLSAVVNK